MIARILTALGLRSRCCMAPTYRAIGWHRRHCATCGRIVR